ncbi:MAG: hypothetical protein ABL892_02170 [Thiobacillaceae bacterium]
MHQIASDTLRQMPRGVWALGFVSLLMDVSSEMIHSLLPLFMVTVLGASALMVGVIEGIAESTALIVKVFSGVLSDYAAACRNGLVWARLVQAQKQVTCEASRPSARP